MTSTRKRKSENDENEHLAKRARISKDNEDQEITPSPKLFLSEEVKVDLVELERLERALIGLSYFRSKQKIDALTLGLSAYLRLLNWAVDRGQISPKTAFHRARIITSRVAFAGLGGFSPDIIQSDQFYSFVMEPLRVLRDKAYNRGVKPMELEIDELVEKFGSLETKEQKITEPILFPLELGEIKKTKIAWWNDENVEAADSHFVIKNAALGSSLENIKNLLPILNAIDISGIAKQYQFENQLDENRQIAIEYAVAVGRLTRHGPLEDISAVTDAIDLLALEISKKNDSTGTINVPYLHVF